MATNQDEANVLPAVGTNKVASKASGTASVQGTTLQGAAAQGSAASQVGAVLQGGSAVLGGANTNIGGANTSVGAAPHVYTINTPQGQIQATASDGTINAEGGGQTLVANGQSNADGSWQSRTDYAQTGQPPYLTIQLASTPNQKASLAFASGASQLTLAVSVINATSGTATLSGTWNGAAVNWTGHADFTTNPLTTNPVAGWPKGAFASQVQTAAFFAPLESFLAPQIAPKGAVRDKSTGAVILDAAAWCAAGASQAVVTGLVSTSGAAATNPVSGTALAVIGIAACVTNAGASIVGDLSGDDIPADPPPDPDPPTDPEPIDDGLDNQSAQDGNDGDPGGSSGGSGGCFVAGTPVRTGNDGLMAIDWIALESTLASCDMTTGVVSHGSVTSTVQGNLD